jgi:hypothetical protein
MTLKQLAQQRIADMFAMAVDDQNKNLAMNRAATAQMQGLDPSQYGATFPGANVNITLAPDSPPATTPAATTTTAAPAAATQSILNPVLAALAAAGLTLGGVTLATRPAASTPPAATVPTATPTTPTPAAAPTPPAVVSPALTNQGPLVYDVEQQQQADGTWKEIWRSPKARAK